MSAEQIFGESKDSEQDQWLSVADLMAGLMVLFLFIAIAFILQAVNTAQAWQDSRDEIYASLKKEFKDDLPRWNAEIEPETLTIRFNTPRVFFDTGEAKLKKRFKVIIGDFFPRFIRLLHSKHRKEISEVRIEGHTSSEWIGICEFGDPYFCNMKLSQERTRAALEYAYRLPEVRRYRGWIKRYLTANGLSSSQLRKVNGREDKGLSRRVEFRVRTNAEKKMEEIIRDLEG